MRTLTPGDIGKPMRVTDLPVGAVARFGDVGPGGWRVCVLLALPGEEVVAEARVDVQAADRERETQLDAMRATVRRLEAENGELRAAVADGVKVSGELAAKQRLWEGTRYARDGRVSSYALWLELVRALGVDCDGLTQMHEVQAAALAEIGGLIPALGDPTLRSRDEAIVRSTIEWFREGVDTEDEIAHVVSEVLSRKDVLARIMAGKPPPDRKPKRRSRASSVPGNKALVGRKGVRYSKTAAGARAACKCKGAHSARCKARQLRAGVVLRRPGT